MNKTFVPASTCRLLPFGSMPQHGFTLLELLVVILII